MTDAQKKKADVRVMDSQKKIDAYKMTGAQDEYKMTGARKVMSTS